jgi:hypothetical protein
MTWYPAYLDSKQEIVDMASYQRPGFTTDDVKDVDVKMADTKIFLYLSNEGIDVDYSGTEPDAEITPSDINNFLWAASIAFNLEFLSYRGVIHYQTGGIQKTRFGEVMHQFMRQQPMFFLGSGSLENIDKVMPFHSFKQLGQLLVNAFIKAYHRNKDGSAMAKPAFGWDASSRGYGWNASVKDYIEQADKQFET